MVENYTSAKDLQEIADAQKEKEESSTHKLFDLRDQEEDPQNVQVRYLGNYVFEATGKRLEQIVRMTDFENMEAVMRVYDVLDKMGVMKDVQKQLNKLLASEGKDKSYFFEGSTDEDYAPKIRIGEKFVPLEKLKFEF